MDRVATRSKAIDATPCSLYDTAPKISADKYQHLQDLKAFVPVDYHSFYDNLAHL
jgi:hypothetical protein